MRLDSDRFPDWLGSRVQFSVDHGPSLRTWDEPCGGRNTDPKLLVVIVNYRTPDLTINCLGSLADEVAHLPGCQVVVIDNASNDRSVDRIRSVLLRERWSAWASVLPLDRNRGFAFGNNAAIRPVLATSGTIRYVLLLNPDTIVLRGAIGTLMSFLDQRPEVGIAGSRLEDGFGMVQCSAHRLPRVVNEWEGSVRLGLVSRWLRRYATSLPLREEPAECEWVSGASMMIRREVFHQIGLLDEGYFLYFEEVDFCRRARHAGWRVWYVPHSRVVHLEGRATGLATPRRRRPPYWFESRRRYFLKHHGALYAIGADLARMVGTLVYRLHRRLRGRPADLDPPWFLTDLIRHSVLVRGRRI